MDELDSPAPLKGRLRFNRLIDIWETFDVTNCNFKKWLQSVATFNQFYMETEFNIKEHGDQLEREYADFLQKHFKTYVATWKLYIGNRGDNTKSKIADYPSERDEKRQQFSENTYTILQSLILISRLIEKDVFSKNTIRSLTEKLDLQDNLMLYFTHIGRIRDNVVGATKCLLDINVNKVESQLEDFFYKRHIFVHGKTIPIIFKTNGEIYLPVLSKDNNDKSGWNLRESNWNDVKWLPKEELHVTTSQLYCQLLNMLNQIFGEFKKKIEKELKQNNLKLEFDWSHSNLKALEVDANSIDVYGIANKKNIKW